jgi:hypothetical protein
MFKDFDGWAAFRRVPSVEAALDQVPDRISGLFVHRGRGGTDPALFPARPRPIRGAGGAALPIPVEELVLELRPSRPEGPVVESVFGLDSVA